MKKTIVLLFIIFLGSSALWASESYIPVSVNYSAGPSVITPEKGKVKPRKTSTKKNTLKKPRQRPHQKREKGTPIIL